MKTSTKIALAATYAFLLYAHKQRKNNTPKIFYRKNLLGNHNALTVVPFGIFIKESERNNKMLLKHELVHWQQFQREGFLPFLFNYLKEAVTKGYDKNNYEIEARLLSGENQECLTNYTNCVRNGCAKTVFNPNFR